MRANPWKTRIQLWEEKSKPAVFKKPTERMQRGLDLEPIARELFEMQSGIKFEPKVILHSEHDWIMASLDGMSECGRLLEIKCPGIVDHAKALSGEVPSHYYPQLQHQMFCADVSSMFYFSFDGFDGVTVVVQRDQEYINRMFEEEKQFYNCVMSEIPPEN